MIQDVFCYKFDLKSWCYILFLIPISPGQLCALPWARYPSGKCFWQSPSNSKQLNGEHVYGVEPHL